MPPTFLLFAKFTYLRQIQLFHFFCTYLSNMLVRMDEDDDGDTNSLSCEYHSSGYHHTIIIQFMHTSLPHHFGGSNIKSWI